MKGKFEVGERVRIDAPGSLEWARFRDAFQGREGDIVHDHGEWVEIKLPAAKHDRPQHITVMREWVGRVPA